MLGTKEREEAEKRVKKNKQSLEKLVDKIVHRTENLYTIRNNLEFKIKEYTIFINKFSKTPKSFITSLNAIDVNISEYTNKQIQVEELLKNTPNFQGKVVISGGVAIGGGVAALAPSAAMAIATTFGTASTGTAIASLSGAAATNAALAWLGGGALAAGGGGMAVGNALLTLAGPVGLGIAAVGVIGGGLLMKHSNLNQKEKADKVAAELEVLIRKYDLVFKDITGIEQQTNKLIKLLDKYYGQCNGYKRDYNFLNKSEQENLASFVNLLKSASELLNKEVKFIN